jgi:1-acyl-sn-glycerol-3-phosphate acyltransferase
VYGAERIPPGPFILVANHTSRLDPFLLCLLPFSVARRVAPLYFLTAKNQYDRWYRPLIKSLGAFPIAPRGWTLEQFFSSSLKTLRAGKSIMIFPEGKIIRQAREPARPGIAYLMRQAKVPIVPLHIAWDGPTVKAKRLRLAFGDPLNLRDLKQHSLPEQANEIMDVVYSL